MAFFEFDSVPNNKAPPQSKVSARAKSFRMANLPFLSDRSRRPAESGAPRAVEYDDLSLDHGQRLELLVQDVGRVGVQPVVEDVRINRTEVDAEVRIPLGIEFGEVGRTP